MVKRTKEMTDEVMGWLGHAQEVSSKTAYRRVMSEEPAPPITKAEWFQSVMVCPKCNTEETGYKPCPVHERGKALIGK